MGRWRKWNDHLLGSLDEYRGSGGAGHINNFLTVWVRNIILVDRMGEQEMVTGDWMRNPHPVLIEDGQGEVYPGGGGWGAACCVQVHCG